MMSKSGESENMSNAARYDSDAPGFGVQWCQNEGTQDVVVSKARWETHIME